MAVYFCTETGVRIAGPGVSKAVDPKNGFDEVTEDGPVKGKKRGDKPADVTKGDEPVAQSGSGPEFNVSGDGSAEGNKPNEHPTAGVPGAQK